MKLRNLHNLTPRDKYVQDRPQSQTKFSKNFSGFLVLFLAVLAAFLISSTNVSGQNLLENASFENGFNNWQVSNSSRPTGHNQCSSTYAAWINNNGGNPYSYVRQENVASEGKKYKLTFRGSERNDDPSRVRLQALNASGDVLAEQNTRLKGSGWKGYTLILAGTPPGTKKVRVVAEAEDGGQIKVDCFDLRESSGTSYSKAWAFDCEDGKTVDVYSIGADCSQSRDAEIEIPSSSSVYRVVMEVVYKSDHPASPVVAKVGSTNVNLYEIEIAGGSSGVYVYRGEYSGSASSVYHNSATGNCGNGRGLQSLVTYAFRDQTEDVNSSGQFTSISGYCDIQGFVIGIPSAPTTRDLVVHLPISELTLDGRHAEIVATAGNVTASETITYPSVGCCVEMVEIELKNVAGGTKTVEIDVNTLPESDPNPTKNCGHSYVISGGVKVEAMCASDPCVDISALAEVDKNLVKSRTISNSSISCSTPSTPSVFFSNCFFDDCSGDKKRWKKVGFTNFEEYSDGTAFMTMTIENEVNSSHRFDVEVIFSGRTQSPPAGSPKLGICATSTQADWYYYTTTHGSLIGKNGLSGAVLTLTRKAEAFQLGTGAGLYEGNKFGASGWLNYNVLKQPTSGPKIGDNAGLDFNFLLSGGAFNHGATADKICPGEKATLEAFATGGTPPYSYKWNKGLGSGKTKMVNPTANTTYRVTITDSKGCKATDDVEVLVKECSSLGDFVFIDKNGNGRQDSGENGLDGVKVELKNSSGTVIKTDFTSNGGKYLFEDLTAGQYKVCFTKPSGYQFTKQNVGSDDKDSDANVSTGMTGTYTLGNDETILTVDAGLYKPASLGDYVWLDKDKDGIQDGGEKPLEKIDVDLYNSKGVKIKSTETNSSGLYYFGDLAPGQYYVKFDIPSGLMFTLANQGSNDTRDSDVDDSNGSGTTKYYTLSSGEYDKDIDAGAKCTVEVSASSDQTTCEGECKDISATASKGSGTYKYTWSHGLGSGRKKVVCPTTTTTYTVTVTDVDGCCSATDQVTINVNKCIDLQLIKSVNNKTPNVGDDVTFSLKLTNDGPSRATGVQVKDYVPNGYTNITSISGGGNVSGSTITWNNLALNNGQTITLTFKAEVKAPGAGVDYDNIAEITKANEKDVDSTPGNGADTNGNGKIGPLDPDGSQDPNDEDDGDNEEVSPKVIDLQLIKSVNKSNPSVGETVTFTITVKNDGPSQATGVQIKDVVPNGYDNLNASASGGSVSGNMITWSNQTFNNGQTRNYTFTARVLIPKAGVSYVNVAEITKADQYDVDSKPGNGADTNGNGKIGPLDPDGSQDPNDEDDGDDAVVDPKCNLIADAGRDVEICNNGCTGLKASATGGSGSYRYQWNQGLGVGSNHQVCPSTTTTYKVTVTDFVTGCTDTDEVTVKVNPSVKVDAGANQTVCEGSCIELKANPSGGTGPFKYEWSNGKKTRTIEVCPTRNTTYKVTVTDKNGCTDEDQVTIETKKCGSIGDFVWEDKNGNGQQDVGEPGIGGVKVTLTDGVGNPLKSRTTDMNGKYLFDTLMAGSYMVLFELPTGYDEFTSANVGNDNTDSDANVSTGKTGVISLSAGEDDLTNDAGVYKYASLGDYVWADGDEDGLQDFDEEGINGLEVKLKNSSGGVLETTTTVTKSGKKGFYEFTKLKPGKYIVMFMKPGDTKFSKQDEGGNDGIDSDADVNTGNSDAVTLESGEHNPTIDAGVIYPIDLELIKSVNNKTPNVGDDVTFTIRVKNNGPGDATGVQVKDYVPNGYTNITSISGGGNVSGGVITWSNKSIGDGGTLILTFKAEVKAPGVGVDYDNIAEVTKADQTDSDSEPGNGADTNGNGKIGPLDPDGSQDPNDEDDGDNEEVSPKSIDLELIKSVNNKTPNVGDDVTFSIKLTNRGPDRATGVQVKDDVPNGYTNITSISGGGNVSGSTITWNNLALNNGQTITLTFKAEVKAPGAGVDYDNIAEITKANEKDVDSTPGNGADTNGNGKIGPLDPDGSQDPNDEDDGDNEEVSPKVIDLQLIKSVNKSNPSVGETVTFTITVKNDGPSQATGVQIKDVVPNGYDNLNASASGGSVSGNMITWSNQTFNNGQTRNYTFTARVLIPKAGVSYVNVAEITKADQYDVDSKPGNGADTNGNGKIGPLDPDGSQDPNDEDDGDDAVVDPKCNLIADAGRDVEICNNGCTGLKASATGGSGSYRYQWNQGLGVGSNHQVCPSTTTTYKVTVTDFVTGCTDTDEVTVKVNPSVKVDAGANQTVCEGSCIELKANPSGGTGPFKYEWSNGKKTRTIEVCPTRNTTYKVTVTDKNGCTDEDQVTIETKKCGSIGDFVWEDKNGNGQQDVGEPGIGGVKVTLTDGVGNPLKSRTTDMNGKYLFDTLMAGSYMVLFELPTGYDEFTSANVGNDNTDSDANVSTGKTGVISLSAGEDDLTNDAGVYKYASLGDYVWADGDEDGLQDFDEEGINGLEVKLKNSSGGVLETTTTVTKSGKKGFYEFTKLKPGKYIVMFMKPGDTKFSKQDEGGNDGIDSDADVNTGNSDAVTLESGEHNPTIDAGVIYPIDLELIKSVNNKTPNVGDDVTFTIRVKNNGPGDATGVQVKDYVPNGYTNITSISGGGNVSGGVITWSNKSIGDGGTLILTFKAEVKAPGVGVDYDNIAEVTKADQTDSDSEPGNGADTNGNGKIGPLDPDGSQDPNDEDDGDNEEVSPKSIDLELIKSVNNKTPNVGDDVTFSIKLTNRGPDRATGVQVKDDVPNGYTNITSISGGGNVSGSTITWNNLALNKDQTITLTFKAEVKAPGAGVDYDNIAEVTKADQHDVDSKPGNGADTNGNGKIGPLDPDGSQDPNDEDDGDNEEVSPKVIDLQLIKSVNKSNPSVGETVTFTITVKNDGPSQATGVQIKDVVPNGYDNLNASASGGSVSGNMITWSNQTFNNGQTRNYTFTARVLIPKAGVSYVNVAEITKADQYDVDSKPGNGADTNGNGKIGPLDPDGSQDPNDEDDGDDAVVDPKCNLIADAGRDVEICNNGCTGLKASATGGSGSYRYQWNQGLGVGSNHQVCPSTTTTYKVTVTDFVTGCTDTDVVTVKVNPSVKVDAGANQTVCEGSCIELKANPSGGTGPFKYEWSNGKKTRTIEVCPTRNTTYKVTVTDKNGCTDEDQVTIETKKCGSIGDFVWEDKNGNGQQDVGEPGIGGVKVTLTDGVGNPLKDQFTDVNGKYLFDTLPAGNYMVLFNLPTGFDKFTSANVGGDNQDSDANVTTGKTGVISLSAGENDLTNDAGVYKYASLGDYVWNDTNGNGMQDFDENGINGVVVKLKDRVGSVITSTTTVTKNGKAGFYEFTNLSPGTYSVQFDDPSGFDFTQKDAALANDSNDSDADPISGMTPNTVLESGEHNPTLDAGFWKPSSLGDYVWEDKSIDGIQNDSGNDGLNGVDVELVDISTGETVDKQITRSNPRNGRPGYYCFENLTPGDYFVRFVLPTGSSLIPTESNQTNESMDSDVGNFNGPNTTERIRVVAGTDYKDVDAGFYLPSKIGDYVFEDNGRGPDQMNGIQDNSESGLKGVRVTLYDVTTTQPVPGIAPIVTKEDGFYQFCVLPGNYYVKFDPPAGYLSSPADMGANDTKDSDVTNTFGPNTTQGFSVGYGEENPTIDAGFFDMVLPVQLISFDAQLLGEEVAVTWATASEQNSDYYIVERRHESEDQFSPIGQVDAKGTVATISNYQLIDQQLYNSGIYYYRLKQYDLNGAFDYSHVVAVEIDNPTSVNLDFGLFPNPANESVNLTFDQLVSEDIEIQIISVDGKIYQPANLIIEQNRIKLNTTEMAEGAYYIQVKDNAQIVTKSLIITK